MTSVLLVEDERDLRDLIGSVLVESGLAVTQAMDGTQALVLLQDTAFDVVISDVSMPGGISGIDLAESIRQQHPDTRIILVSGHSRGQLPQLPDYVLFVPKPYSITQLLDLVTDQQ